MRIGVVGAGMMGAEIALVWAIAGYDVVLNDLQEAELARASQRIALLLDKGVLRGHYTEMQRERSLSLIRTTTDTAALGDRELVTEAVFEDLHTKQTLLKRLDTICPRACVLTSNTSTLPISTLAAVLSPARRSLFLGTHYFSPVSRMQLVEVIPGFDTDPATSARIVDCLREIGKLPILVKDVAGFAVNRLLHAMLVEAVKLVEEGVATPEEIDLACRLGLGHPIGPFALIDRVSSNLCVRVQQILHEAYGERFRPPALLKQFVAATACRGSLPRQWVAAK